MHPDERTRLFTDWLRDDAAIVQRAVHAFAVGDDQADLRQEVLLALWRATAAFRGECLASTFVYRVAHNTALTWRRSERNYRRRVDAAAELAVRSPPLADPDRDGTREAAHRLERVYAAIRSLPPLDRSLILLSLDGLGYREIAAVHGLTESNVGTRLTRARQRLAERLDGTQEHDDERAAP